MKTIIIDGIEYNLTPKVLFKKGDFVVIQETTYLISKIEGINVTLFCNGRECLFDIDVLKNARLWDISKDAKDGDVLATENFIFIFKNIDDNNGVHYYCHYEINKHEDDNQFGIALPQSLMGRVGDIISRYYPATKEQRDTLMKAIAAAGYTFDFEKKELKKIGQKPAWSEEDEKKLLCICAWIKYYPRIADFKDEMYTVANNYIGWLESFRLQSQWKPSDEQIYWLKWAIGRMPDTEKANEAEAVLEELLEQLKKLKGE